MIRAVVLIVAVVCTGCAPMKVDWQRTPGVNLAKYRTFAWWSEFQPPTGIARLDNPALHAIIRDEMARQLSRRGYRLTDAQPDIFLSYTVDLQRNVVATLPLLDGDAERAWGEDRFSREKLGSESAYVKDVEQGTLVIEIIDAAALTPVWRGYATAVVSLKDNARVREWRVRTAVDRICWDVPSRLFAR